MENRCPNCNSSDTEMYDVDIVCNNCGFQQIDYIPVQAVFEDLYVEVRYTPANV